MAPQLRFNHVLVFDRKVHMATISNTLWIAYFIVVGVRGVLGTCRYIVTVDPQQRVDSGTFLAGAFFQGVAGSVLIMALNHQRIFRTDAEVRSVQSDVPRRSLAERGSGEDTFRDQIIETPVKVLLCWFLSGPGAHVPWLTHWLAQRYQLLSLEGLAILLLIVYIVLLFCQVNMSPKVVLSVGHSCSALSK